MNGLRGARTPLELLRAAARPLRASGRPVVPVPTVRLPVGPREKLAERRRRSLARRRGVLVRGVLIASDLLAFSLAFIGAELIFSGGEPTGGSSFASRGALLIFVAALVGWFAIVKLYGLYGQDEERANHSTADDIVPVLHVVTVAVWLFQGVSWITGYGQSEFPKLLAFWALAIGLVTAGRVIARQICRRQSSYIQNTLILGADEVGQLIGRKLLRHPEYGLNLVGFVDGPAVSLHGAVAALPLLGGPADLPEIIRERAVERVIVAGVGDDSNSVATIHALKNCDVQIDIVPKLFEVVGPGVGIHTVEGIPLIGLPPTRLSPTSLLLKRTIDRVGSAVLLLLLAPLFAWIAWRVRRDSPGPVFFQQARLGLNMREFTVLKFRTMNVGASEDIHREYIKQIMDIRAAPNRNGLYKLERAGEITPFGRWLRKTSLDELPQLLNVLRGEMSLVGPRPCLAYEVDNFKPHHLERFSVPPGITGLWQVTARARSTYVEALEMDVAYARGWSLGLDLWILSRTPAQVLKPGGTA